MAGIKAPTSQGKAVNELIIKGRLSPEAATRQVLGMLADKYTLPAGATVIQQGINDIIYKDAQGYTHRIQREGDANSPNFGQVRELQTDRPAVLPLTDQIPGLSSALQGAINTVQSTIGGGQLPPEVAAALGLQSQNERAQLEQQATKTQGELVTGLYGQGINQSTIANSAGADFSQALAIALGNQQAAQAARELDYRKFITGSGLDLINSITGQETSRAGASAQVGLGKEQLAETSNQAARNFLLEWQKYQASQKTSLLKPILAAAASFIPYVGPAVGSLIAKSGTKAGSGGDVGGSGLGVLFGGEGSGGLF